jgi:hypothetical protein
MMSEKEVPNAIAQRIVIRFLTKENVKPAEIFHRLHEQFTKEYLSEAQVLK